MNISDFRLTDRIRSAAQTLPCQRHHVSLLSPFYAQRRVPSGTRAHPFDFKYPRIRRSSSRDFKYPGSPDFKYPGIRRSSSGIPTLSSCSPIQVTRHQGVTRESQSQQGPSQQVSLGLCKLPHTPRMHTHITPTVTTRDDELQIRTVKWISLRRQIPQLNRLKLWRQYPTLLRNMRM